MILPDSIPLVQLKNLDKTTIAKFLNSQTLPLTPHIIHTSSGEVLLASETSLYRVLDPYEGVCPTIWDDYQTVVRKLNFVPDAIFSTIFVSLDNSGLVTKESIPLSLEKTDLPAWDHAMVEVTFNI